MSAPQNAFPNMRALLSVRMLAAGTRLRVGPRDSDFAAVEDLSPGDLIFDPAMARYRSIRDMDCRTLSRDKARARGLDMVRTVPGQMPLVVESPDLGRGSQAARLSDDGVEMVFYRLSFDGRAVVDLGETLCQMD